MAPNIENRALAAAPPQIPIPPQWDRDADQDNQIYALVVLGGLLQGLGALSGIAFAVCILKVSPLFLFAEVISVILWGLGEELKQARLWPDGSVYIPHFTNNEFIPNQAIGLPKRGQNCCFNAAIQIALASEGVDRRLNNHPNIHPFKQVYNRVLGARQDHQSIAHQGNTQLIREDLARFTNGHISAHSYQQEDACDILNELLNQLAQQTQEAEHPFRHEIVDARRNREPQQLLILQPTRYLEQLRAGQIPPEATTPQKFLAYLMRPFFFDVNGNGEPVQRKFSALPDELFIQFSRTVNEDGLAVRIRKINDPLPIPLNFALPHEDYENAREDDLNRFEADAFVIHNGNSMRSGHYVAYTRTHDPETGFTWWKIDDRRVEPIYTREAEEALKRAYIVHFRRHPRI